MSLEEYASGLVSIATGWLGWKFDEAIRMDCLAIAIAYEGRCDMLKAIFGGEDEPKPLTQATFRAIFGKS